MNQEKIGKFIYVRRKLKGLTQAELAENLGVTNRSVSNWENGKNMPDLSLYQQLCNELDITINELLSGEEIEENNYQKKFEENIVKTISNSKKKSEILFKMCCLFIFIVFLISVGTFTYNHFYGEFKTYNLYNDSTREWMVRELSFHKNLSLQMEAINKIKSDNNLEKETEGTLIYDFSKYDIIPILNYINKEGENIMLTTGFSKIMDFIDHFTLSEAGNPFIVNEDNNEYRYDNGIYYYKAQKNVIKKSFFQKSYQEYLQSKSVNNVEVNFINALYQFKSIKEKFSLSELKKQINENYEKFYEENKENVLSAIGMDLYNYSVYLANYIAYTVGEIGYTQKKEIESEPVILTFKVSYLGKAYDKNNKYITTSYKLDIEDAWNQLKNKSYPKLYI